MQYAQEVYINEPFKEIFYKKMSNYFTAFFFLIKNRNSTLT